MIQILESNHFKKIVIRRHSTSTFPPHLRERTKPVLSKVEGVGVYSFITPHPNLPPQRGEGINGGVDSYLYSPYPNSFDITQDKLPSSAGKERKALSGFRDYPKTIARYFLNLILVIYLPLILFTIGCQPDNSPVPIDKGLDMCEYCRMTISDLHYAGEIIERKKLHKFDDIGCMLAYAQTHNLNTNNASFWVMDFDSLNWIKAEEANYVLSSEIKTPMAYGIIAFKDPFKANDTADKTKGEVLQFQYLFNIDWKARHAH